MTIVGIIIFVIGWIYAIAKFGFFLGLGLGWIPAFFFAKILEFLLTLIFGASLGIIGLRSLRREQSAKDSLAIAGEFTTSRGSYRHGAVNGYDSNGYTPLMNAVNSYDLVRVKELLAKGADPKLKDNNFGTSTASDMAHLALRRATDENNRATLKQIIMTLDN